MTDEQKRFLALHAHRLVTKWQWLFSGGTLRAEAGREVATISRQALGELADAGFVECFDLAGVRLTARGREAIA